MNLTEALQRRRATGGVSLRDRIGYAFDNFMSRGTAALVLALFAATALVVIVVSAVIWVAGWARPEVSLIEVLWRSMLATFDPAIVGGESGGPWFLLALLAVTLAGIFVTSILIGILVTGIEGRLAELRKGRSRVIASGHTVILGWSQEIFAVLGELVVANANQWRKAVVVLAERDKVEMEDEIRSSLPGHSRTRIVCRSGSSMDQSDLRIANIDAAKSIVVLSSGTKNADAGVIKTILAITNSPGRRSEPYHIVAELRNPSNLEAAKIAAGGEAQFVVVGDLVARIIAQTCRQSGLSVVYEALLDFEGDEIYFADLPDGLVGATYGDLLFAYEKSAVIGLLDAADEVVLDPPMDRVLVAGDRVVAISEDDDTVRAAPRLIDGIEPELIREPPVRPASAERTLVLGWNRRAEEIIRELDRYVEEGSIVVMADQPHVEKIITTLRDLLAHQHLDCRGGDPADRHQLEAICAERFDHVIVLSSDELEPQLADAQTLITLLHLREIDARNGYNFSITSEMIDLRNRTLAQVTRADDFIVSDRIASLVVSQLSENRHLKAVFDDLFDSEGPEIYLRPMSDYVATEREITFTTVLEAGRRRGETVVGYRRMVDADDPEREYGVVINPAKSAPLTFQPADRVIVLAAAG